MKNTITLVTTALLIFTVTACDFDRSIKQDKGVLSFRVDSAGVDKGYYSLEKLFTGTSEGHTLVHATRSVEQKGDEVYELRFSHFNNSFKGKGVYTKQDSLLEASFQFTDTTKATYPSYYFKNIDSLRLEYTKVEKELIAGEFYLKVRSKDIEDVVYTLTEGKFEFTDYEQDF